MTPKQIESSIINHVFTTVTGETITNHKPSTLDPLQDGAQRYLEVYIGSTKGNASRGAVDEYTVSVELVANSRSKTEQYDALDLLQTAIAALRRTVVLVKDFETGGEPTVGHIHFREEETDVVQQTGPDQWQIRSAVIVGVARNLPPA